MNPDRERTAEDRVGPRVVSGSRPAERVPGSRREITGAVVATPRIRNAEIGSKTRASRPRGSWGGLERPEAPRREAGRTRGANPWPWVGNVPRGSRRLVSTGSVGGQERSCGREIGQGSCGGTERAGTTWPSRVTEPDRPSSIAAPGVHSEIRTQGRWPTVRRGFRGWAPRRFEEGARREIGERSTRD